MTARRQARARLGLSEVATNAGGVPQSLLLGRCVEVWATNPDTAPLTAFSRFSRARRWWIDLAGLEVAEACRLLPQGPPWSVEHLTATDRADQVRDRLRRAGVTKRDLPRLRREATALYARAAERA